MKKITIILGLIIIIFALLLGYFYFFKNSATDAKIVNTISNLFPGSDSRDISVDPLFPDSINLNDSNIETTDQTNPHNLTAKFQKISNNGIAGASFVTLKATSTKNLPTTLIWYIEKATGYVFSYNPTTNEQNQISNTTWISGQETYWGENQGNPTFIIRRNKNSLIENFLAKITKTSSSTNPIGELTGINIDSNIYTIASSPKKDRYAYLVSSPNGSIGYLANFSGTGQPVQFFTSPFNNWQISWPEENTLIFQSAPLSDQVGLVYTLNLKTKSFIRQIGGVRGLTTLGSPDGKKILYAENLTLKIKLLNKDDSNSSLGINTLPEKCVWLKDSIKIYCSIPNAVPFGEYPDNWYQGLVNFSDSIWEINTQTGITKQIYNPAEAGNKYQIDGINLFLSKNEDQLFITNKTDYTLWQLNLNDSFNKEPADTTSTSTSI